MGAILREAPKYRDVYPDKAVDAVCGELKRRGYEVEPYGLSGWNDNPETTHADVLSVLRSTIERLEKKDGRSNPDSQVEQQEDSSQR